MPTLEHRDILDVQEGIIVHQINPFVMGAGLAKHIRHQYPEHYEDFKMWRRANENWRGQAYSGEDALGEIVVTTHYAPLYIVGMCAQKEYGFAKKGYTRYDAFESCLLKVDYLSLKYSTKLYIPYKIGCGLAAGDWKLVLHKIKEVVPYAIICKLGKPSNKEKQELEKRGRIHL